MVDPEAPRDHRGISGFGAERLSPYPRGGVWGGGSLLFGRIAPNWGDSPTPAQKCPDSELKRQSRGSVYLGANAPKSARAIPGAYVRVEVPKGSQGSAVGRHLQDAVSGNITTYPATAYIIKPND